MLKFFKIALIEKKIMIMGKTNKRNLREDETLAEVYIGTLSLRDTV